GAASLTDTQVAATAAGVLLAPLDDHAAVHDTPAVGADDLHRQPLYPKWSRSRAPGGKVGPAVATAWRRPACVTNLDRAAMPSPVSLPGRSARPRWSRCRCSRWTGWCSRPWPTT